MRPPSTANPLVFLVSKIAQRALILAWRHADTKTLRPYKSMEIPGYQQYNLVSLLTFSYQPRTEDKNRQGAVRAYRVGQRYTFFYIHIYIIGKNVIF